MKNLKKVLALALTATMAMSMFVTGAGAAFTDQSDIKATDAVNMLSTLGVIEGNPDGSFKPETVVTRAEMAKMIFVVRNNKVDDSAYANISTKFTDIKGHWAQGYIKFCESQGIIAGKSATKFDPDAPVTGTEAAKMLLVLTGYTSDKAGLVGPAWSTNTLKFAAEAGILDDVDSPLESGLPRQYAAQQIANTLDAYRVKWSNDSETFDYFVGNTAAKESVGRKYMSLYSTVGTLTKIEKENITISNRDENASDDGLGNDDSANFIKVKTDYTSFLGQKVKVMYKDGKTDQVIGVYAVSSNTTNEVNANSVEPDDKKIKFGGKSYSLDNNKITVTRTTIDGDTSVIKDATSSYFKDLAQSADKINFIDANGDGSFDQAIWTEYYAAEVTYVSSSQIIAGATYKFDEETISEDLKADDWAVISYDRYKDCKTIVKADKTSAKVNGTKKGEIGSKPVKTYDKFQLESTWYNVSDAGSADIGTIKAGDNVDVVIVNNILYYAKRTSASTNGNITNVAVVVNKDKNLGGNQVKLAFFDGSTKIVDFDGDSKISFNSLALGGTYEFAISGDEYSFTDLTLEDDDYGDFTARKNSAYVVDADTMKFDGSDVTIADDAKVILYSEKETDRKVITGKQLKNLDTIALDGSNNVVVFKGDMGGLQRIGAVVLKVVALPDTVKTNDNYGYITSDAYTSASNTITYKVWTGSEEVEVTEKSSSPSARKAGTVIGYASINEDKEIKDAEPKAMRVAAVTGVNNAETTVSLKGIAGSDKADTPVSGDFDITSSTKKLFLDTDNKTGTETGSIRKAYKENDTEVANVLVLADTANKELEVIVVDTLSKMVGPYVAKTVSTDAQTLTAGTVVVTDDNTFGEVGTFTFGVTPKNYEVVGGETADKDNIVSSAKAVSIKVYDADGADKTSTFDVTKANLTTNNAAAEQVVASKATTDAGKYTIEVTADFMTAKVEVEVKKAVVVNLKTTGTNLALTNLNVTSIIKEKLIGNIGVKVESDLATIGDIAWMIGDVEGKADTRLAAGDKPAISFTMTPDKNHEFGAAILEGTIADKFAAADGYAVTATLTDGVLTVTYTASSVLS